MEEKVLITTKGTAQKTKFKFIWNKKFTIALIVYIICFVILDSIYPYFAHECSTGCKYGYIICIKEQSFIEYIFLSLIKLPIGLIILFILYAGILFLKNKDKSELTVSDKRIWGCTFGGKQVDLPIDSISAISLNKKLGRISIRTSSGAISFGNIPNCEQFHSIISSLISKRQEKLEKQNIVEVRQEVPQSNADELKKYKDLLDSGVITEEEFEAKKKQLLGL